MRYYIIDLVKNKLYPYNNLDELIKQLGAEKEVITPVEEPLENIIFNPRLFNTNEKLTKLKNAMKAFISINPAIWASIPLTYWK